VLFADQGAPGANQAVLGEVAEWAHRSRASARERARGYLTGDYIAGLEMRQRAVIVAQTVGFLADFYDLVERWAAWSGDLIDGDDGVAAARAVFDQVARGRRVVGRASLPRRGGPPAGPAAPE